MAVPGHRVAGQRLFSIVNLWAIALLPRHGRAQVTLCWQQCRNHSGDDQRAGQSEDSSIFPVQTES